MLANVGRNRRPDEFASPTHLPKHLSVHTWPSCTLAELSHHLAATSPPLLPDPTIGTRLSFRLVFADTRSNPNQAPKYVVKDLGSLVIGAGGPGIPDPDEASPDDSVESNDAFKTLSDVKFVIGDYISVAILPSDSATGAVAAPGDARTGRGAGIGEARSSMGVMPPPQRDTGPPGYGRGRGSFRGAPRGRGPGPRGWGDRDAILPEGEWRRGERLPESPMGRGRGRPRDRDWDRQQNW